VVAQGRVVVTARYLNINGLIQSGVQTMTLHVGPEFVGTTTGSLLGNDGRPLAGIDFGDDGVPVDGYFDAEKQAIVVDEIVSKGGEIVLAGQILSTGNGQLKAAHGYASVDIDNQSAYDLILNRIDTTKRREGKITIIDTARLQKVEYVVDGEQVRTTTYQGTLAGDNGRITYAPIGSPQTSSLADDLFYEPRPGLRYVWTEGQEKSEVVTKTYQKKSFNLLGFDWDGLVADTNLKSVQTVYTGEIPLLESEVLSRKADYRLPALAEDFSRVYVAPWTNPANPYAEHWKVKDEGTNNKPSNWYVSDGRLVQSSNIWGGGTTAQRKGTYLVYEDSARQADQWRNYELSVDVYCSDNDGVGVMFRYTDENNYYKLEMDNDYSSGRNFRKLFKMVNGVEQTLWTDPTPRPFAAYPMNTWFNVKVTAVGGEIQMFLGGDEIGRVTDPSPLERGTVAMYCWGQQNAYFDNIRVQHLSPHHREPRTWSDRPDRRRTSVPLSGRPGDGLRRNDRGP
jgi:hypothetical protein